MRITAPTSNGGPHIFNLSGGSKWVVRFRDKHEFFRWVLGVDLRFSRGSLLCSQDFHLGLWAFCSHGSESETM